MERGQAHTLEAFTAALLLIGGIVFALQATAVTPLSASSSNQHIRFHQALAADDVLAAAAEDGSLLEGAVYWNPDEERFEGTGDQGYYTDGGPPNNFGHLLNETFRDEHIAFNVYLTYWDDRFREETMVYMGSPSDNAATASRTITLYNDTELTAPDFSQNVSSAAESGDFYASDVSPDEELFNLVEVRIVVWRM